MTRGGWRQTGAKDEWWRRRQELKDGSEEVKEMACGGEDRGREGVREEREAPPLSADKRQKWMNPIGRRASSSLLSPVAP